MSFGSGAEATAAAYRFWEITASGRRFDSSEVFEEEVEEIRGVLEVVQSDRVEQPAFRSWPLFRRNELRNIAPANAKKKDQKQRK